MTLSKQEQQEQRLESRERHYKAMRMRETVAKFQKYVATYTEQAHYEDYSTKIFIEDMLYGIGISLQTTPADYTGAGGYERFKQMLREIIK